MVGFTVEFFLYTVGSASFLHSFFSTVCYNLENQNWGSKFPLLMNELYQGILPAEKVGVALEELAQIRNELCKLPPESVIWDIDDLSKQPPWGNRISSDIKDLSSYFVTSDGDDFITVFRHALEKANELHAPIKIESI